MKKILLIAVCLFAIFAIGCSRVEPGQVGVKVYLLGGSKGVDHEVLGVGRYWIGMNEELYIFPTFQQNYTWTKECVEGDCADESITFQTKDGLSINADIGITYHIEQGNVANVFQKYRKGVNEITDIVLRNMVRDAFVKHASSYDAEQAYSTAKSTILDSVNATVSRDAIANGISVEKIYYTGEMRLPATVMQAINAKIQATQTAQKIENEVRSAKAEAEKTIATAEGNAKSILMVAEAQAKANELLSRSITDNLVRYKEIEKWNGVKPQVMGGSVITQLK